MNGFDMEKVVPLIEMARGEDLGDGDITSQATIPADKQGRGELVLREDGVICGLPVVEQVLRIYDEALSLETDFEDGRFVESGTVIGFMVGPLRSLLSAERVVLNFLQHLSAISSTTRDYVQAVEGTQARIYDTRKTTPGWRELEKYAVRCGGGYNHRYGLYDAVLIKDNHLAVLGKEHWPAAIEQAVRILRVGERRPEFIQVEVDDLEQLSQVLRIGGIDSVLLDNMNLEELCRAVEMRDSMTGSGVALEASGGITLGKVRAIAEAGIDRISVGALTHTIRNLDIGLDLII
ncbi:MAG: carboxylating nicotinate-nucleotide diphosphorylase [Sedimentisphaerales bacterium]|nr:carboxylating nicotinate-nucleotide diphosphorylase [Sedimentisphaerales bacterium]